MNDGHASDAKVPMTRGPGNKLTAPRRSALGTVQRVALDAISGEAGMTRALCGAHVAALASSIGTLGLIHPIVVNAELEVLAGRHRLAALHALREKDDGCFVRHFPAACVPVHIMDLPGSDEVRGRLAIELAENEKRRDYTPDEVRAWAARLAELGYATTVGRKRRQDDRGHVTQALAAFLGKSERTVRRLLHPPQAASADSMRQLLAPARRALRECAKVVSAAAPDGPARRIVLESLAAAATALQRVLASSAACLTPDQASSPRGARAPECEATEVTPS